MIKVQSFDCVQPLVPNDGAREVPICRAPCCMTRPKSWSESQSQVNEKAHQKLIGIVISSPNV